MKGFIRRVRGLIRIRVPPRLRNTLSQFTGFRKTVPSEAQHSYSTESLLFLIAAVCEVAELAFV